MIFILKWMCVLSRQCASTGLDAWSRRQLLSAAGAALGASAPDRAAPLLRDLADTLRQKLLTQVPRVNTKEVWTFKLFVRISSIIIRYMALNWDHFFNPSTIKQLWVFILLVVWAISTVFYWITWFQFRSFKEAQDFIQNGGPVVLEKKKTYNFVIKYLRIFKIYMNMIDLPDREF